MKFLTFIIALFILTGTSAEAQDWARDRLNKSPRHLDWVTIKRGDREIKCFIAYPEVKNKATSVLVIHEIFGLSDWVRGVCDQLAQEGYIAIAPDLLSGQPGQDSSKYQDIDAQRKAITSLPPEQVTGDLNATSNYVVHLPAANGKLAVAGFCWGGTQTFRYATNNPTIKSAFVFYGTAPENAADIARINTPVYGFYGEKDARVTSTVEKTAAVMKSAGKNYEPTTYAGAGHGFMRTGQAPDAETANRTACGQAWERMDRLLHQI